jgi:streptogramin lyase
MDGRMSEGLGRHRGRSLRVTTLLAAAAVAIAVAGPWQAGSAASPAVPSPTIQPGLPDGVVAEIPLDSGVAPLNVVEAAGSVWVSSHRGTTLYGIDPTSNQVTSRIDIGQESCQLGSAYDLLWISECDDSDHGVVVDPVKGEVVGGFPSIPGELLGFAPDAMWTAVDSGKGWATIRVDPVKLVPEAPLPSPGVAPGGDNYAYVNDSVYVTYSDRPRIAKLDPATGATVESVPLPWMPGDPPDIAASDGAIWILGDASPTLLKFDIASSTVTSYQVPGWQQTSGAHSVVPKVALGSLWLRTSDSTISRMDPATGQVTATYPAGPGGGDAEIAFGSLWVANFNTDTVWREQIDR